MSLLDRVQRKAVETGEPGSPAAVPPAAPSPERSAPAPRQSVAPARHREAASPPSAPVSNRTAEPVERAAEAPSQGAARNSGLLSRAGLTARGSMGSKTGVGNVYAQLRARVHQRLVEDLAGNPDSAPPETVRQRIHELMAEVIAEQGLTLTKQDRQRMAATVIDDVLGLGPLEALIADPEVTEVMINGHKQVYVEQKGKLSLSKVTFESTEQLMQVIDRIVSSIGRRIDESSPMVDARLKDGSRVNVIIPPLALCGPTVTIRKFAKEALTIDDLLQYGTITEPMVTFLRACVRGRMNVIVSGGTGSGKTTTLNILSSFIPESERIVTIEDAAELQLRQDHVVTLETRPANVEGRGRVSIRDLVINSLRMRPDRIVVGECRGGEALDMLQAMNTGHDGSLTTLHANNTKDCLSRLETLVLMAGAELPSRAIREQIGSAVHLIVQVSRLRDGTRKIISIAEVLGFKDGEVSIQEIFGFKQTGVDEDGKVQGFFAPTGVLPNCLERLAAQGEGVPKELFSPVHLMEQVS